MSGPAWFVIERRHGRLVFAKSYMNPADMNREAREGKRFLRLDPAFEDLDLDTLVKLFERGADIAEPAPAKVTAPVAVLPKPPGET